MVDKFPDKDVLIAARLIRKLAEAQGKLAGAEEDFKTLSSELDHHRSKQEARDAYINVLQEIADEIGEDVEKSDLQAIKSLEAKMKQHSDELENAKKEAKRLEKLADKLKAGAPELFKIAEKKAEKEPIEEKEKNQVKPEKNTYEEDTSNDESDVKVVDRILDWDPALSRSDNAVQATDADQLPHDFIKIEAVRANKNIFKPDSAPPLIVFDALNIMDRIGRYKPNPIRDLRSARDLLISDLDSLCAKLGIPVNVVFDTPHKSIAKIKSQLGIHSGAGRTTPDKAASDRQILRLIEEAQLEHKPVAIVTDDVSLSRDAASVGAVHLELRDVFYIP